MVPTQAGAGGHWHRLSKWLPCLCPQPGAVSNSGSRSHLPLPCGNQSSLEKVSTKAQPAPGVIDAGSRNISVGPLPPPWQGPDACHTNVCVPVLPGPACGPAVSAPAPGEMSCSHSEARGP